VPFASLDNVRAGGRCRVSVGRTEGDSGSLRTDEPLRLGGLEIGGGDWFGAKRLVELERFLECRFGL